MSIARTSPAAARRDRADLADLVDKGAFTRTGERRHTCYHLAIPLQRVARVTIDDMGNVVATEPG